MQTIEASRTKTVDFLWSVRVLPDEHSKGKTLFFRSMDCAQAYAESLFGYRSTRVYRPDGRLLCEFEV